MTNDLEREVEGCIVTKLKSFSENMRSRGIKDSCSWTRGIKETLCDIGHDNRFNYWINANGCDKADDPREWLYDLVWGNRGSTFKELYLAMECEWDRRESEIFWDFEKLLVVRARHRIFVFNQSSIKGVEDLIDKLRQKIKIFEGGQPGDLYLLIGFSDDGEEKFVPVP